MLAPCRRRSTPPPTAGTPRPTTWLGGAKSCARRTSWWCPWTSVSTAWGLVTAREKMSGIGSGR
eukprot:3050654-Pyramimonas_sp.AAC.1